MFIRLTTAVVACRRMLRCDGHHCVGRDADLRPIPGPLLPSVFRLRHDLEDVDDRYLRHLGAGYTVRARAGCRAIHLRRPRSGGGRLPVECSIPEDAHRSRGANAASASTRSCSRLVGTVASMLRWTGTPLIRKPACILSEFPMYFSFGSPAQQ
jgi:hypothetical protein